ncbi:MAG TPA: hypothetical protein VFF67_01905 [Thermoplasmata archaeon]|nr:hypothetical protein [Thermoplasmata archaeon]
MAIAVLMAGSPVAGAFKPRVFVAPFTGTLAIPSNSVSASGSCKSTASLKSEAWVPSTGNVTALVSTSAKGCSTGLLGNGYAYANAGANIQLYFPVKVATGGHNFSVKSSYAITLTTAIAGSYICPSAPYITGTYTYSDCSYSMSASTSMYMQLWDATNQSYLYSMTDNVQGPQWYTSGYNYSSCNGQGSCYSNGGNNSCSSTYYYAHCSPSGVQATGTNTTWINSGDDCGYGYSGHCYYWHNWTLNSSHKYWVVISFSMYAYSDMYGYSATHSVAASVNAANGGNTGWKVVSITVQ